MRVRSLAMLGVFYAQRNRLREAVALCGQTLAIATEYETGLVDDMLALLAGVAQAMGAHDFRAAWQDAFPGQEPPLDASQPTTIPAGPTRPHTPH